MGMGRRRRHDGDEQDAYSRRWRKMIAALARAGVVRKTKRRTHKRERRAWTVED